MCVCVLFFFTFLLKNVFGNNILQGISNKDFYLSWNLLYKFTLKCWLFSCISIERWMIT